MLARAGTRPRAVVEWSHVGGVISLTPIAAEERLEEDEELLAIGQDLVLIGIDLDRESLVAALDEAALSDEEFIAGPRAWAGLPDPFPAWSLAAGLGE